MYSRLLFNATSALNLESCDELRLRAFGDAETKREPTTEESAIRAAIAEADAKLRRWEEALERGLLSLEDAAERIKAVRQERADLLKTQSRLEQRARARTDIRPIPTPLMDSYIKEVQKRLREKAIFAKREFLTEIVKEIRVRDKQVTVTYRLPWTPQVLPQIDRTGRFFTVSKWWSQ
jgi:hypothetical protein